MGNEFKLRRGLKCIFAAKVLTDDNGTAGYTVGATRHLIPAGTMTREANSEQRVVYFDDAAFSAVGTEGATTITISGASLRVTDIAWLAGKDIDPDTGAVMDAGEYVENYFAIGGLAEGLDGSIEYFWFHKCSFQLPSIEDLTKDDTTDANGMTLTFNALQTIHIFAGSGKRSKVLQIDDVMSQLKTGKDWTAQVVTPDNKGTICEKRIPTTGVSVTPATATIAISGTTTLTATLAPSGATGEITWSTSDASVATVDATGEVTGVAAGSAVITATSNGLSGSATITVTGE